MIWGFFNKAYAESSSFAPVQGTEIAAKFDALYNFLLWACLISSVLVIGGMIYFAFKYRRQGEGANGAWITHNGLLEFLWSFIPFVIFMFVFGWGWYVYHQLRYAPENAMEIHVGGKQFNWTFTYKSGRISPGTLFVPKDRPVKLIMTSTDVIHSFYIPAFRTKQDVVPGRYTSLWFEATKLGKFKVFCTEFCGDSHSAMLAELEVLEGPAFDSWLENDPYKGKSLLEIGEQAAKQHGCYACHGKTADYKGVGPTWLGVWGSERVSETGEKVVADESYIRESILYPDKFKVKGFGGAVMNSFAGAITDKEIAGLIEYFKTLKE